MANIRAKDLPSTITALQDNDYFAVDEGSSTQTKKANKSSIKQGLALNADRKTVVTVTNPTPDYVGQPGIDTNGKTYVAISLTGTMWEETGGKVDNSTLQKSTAGVLSIKDVGVTAAKLATDAVTAAKLVADAVETAKIKDSAVTSEKINDGAVTNSKLLDQSVNTAKLDFASVINSRIADSTILPGKLGQQTVTVVSETSPTPSYVGQPGKDADGNWWVAVALSGTMWKRMTAFADDIFNFNYNKNYRWRNGISDPGSGVLYQAYASGTVQTIEESNTVFNYRGRCVKGIKNTNDHIVSIYCDSDDFIESTIAVRLEIYIPEGTSFTLYFGVPGTWIETKALTAGLWIYSIDIDKATYAPFNQFLFYSVGPSGDVDNVRIGRMYIGDKRQGILDGSNVQIDFRIEDALIDFRAEYMNADDFIIATRDRYTKPEDLLSNEISFIFEPGIIDQVETFPTNSPPLKEIIDLDMTEMVLPFTKAVRLYFDAPIPVNSYPAFVWRTAWRPTFFVSSWVAVPDSVGNAYGFWIQTIKGVNDTVITFINAYFTFNSGNITAIKAAVDSVGIYESVLTGYTIRCRGYLTYKGVEYFHIECEITTALTETDYIKISFGDVNRLWGTGTQPERLVFGMQIFGDAPVNQFNGQVNYKSIQQRAIDEYVSSRKNGSYEYDNNIVDFFNDAGKTFQQDGTSFSLFHNGLFNLLSGLSISGKVYHDKFHEGYELTYNEGQPIPKFVDATTRNNLIDFNLGTYLTNGEESASHIGFWIDRRELNGNGLVFCDGSGGTWFVRPEDLIAKGFRESRSTPYPIYYEVDEVDGYYTHLLFHIHNAFSADVYMWRLQIYNTSANNVNKLTVYNPTLIYYDGIDPYFRYKSLAEKNRSLWIGKHLTFIGDSEFNDEIMPIELARHYGFNTIDSHYGGHRMAYLNTSWFYKSELRDLVLALPEVDVIIMAVSSNDGVGGGSSAEADVQDVIDNYPYYGDDAGTIAAKLALFNAMSQGEKEAMFTFKACYSAYLKQLHTAFPDIRILLTSIPISTSAASVTGDPDENGWGIWESGHNPDTERAFYDAGYQSKRSQILSLRDKHATNFCDLMNEVGLTYENFLRYCVDGVHWKDEIDYRIAYSIIQELKKLYY